MSVTGHATARRLLAAGVAVFAFSAAGVTPASAYGEPGSSDKERCEFSLDADNWASSVKVDDVSLKRDDEGKVHVYVRPAGDDATCTVSLASYLAHGPTFHTSGLQVFYGFDTVSLKGKEVGTLDVPVPDNGCYAQLDLYRGSIKYDGKLDADDGFEHGKLPKGPDTYDIPAHNLSWWNGGSRNCIPPEKPEPPKKPEKPEKPKPTPSEEPPAPEKPEKPDPPKKPKKPKPTPSEEPPAPEKPEKPDPPKKDPGDNLAETGGGNVTAIAGGAAALLALGGAVLVAIRRKASASRD